MFFHADSTDKPPYSFWDLHMKMTLKTFILVLLKLMSWSSTAMVVDQWHPPVILSPVPPTTRAPTGRTTQSTWKILIWKCVACGLLLPCFRILSMKVPVFSMPSLHKWTISKIEIESCQLIEKEWGFKRHIYYVKLWTIFIKIENIFGKYNTMIVSGLGGCYQYITEKLSLLSSGLWYRCRGAVTGGGGGEGPGLRLGCQCQCFTGGH